MLKLMTLLGVAVVARGATSTSHTELAAATVGRAKHDLVRIVSRSNRIRRWRFGSI